MPELNQNSHTHPTTINTQKSTHCAPSQPASDIFDFNSKKTRPKLKENQSSKLHLSPHKLTESHHREIKLQSELPKPTYLSTLYEKDTPESISSLSFINTPKTNEWAQLQLRKTQSSQTQSSVKRSVIFGNKIEDFKLLKLLGKVILLVSDRRTGFMGAMKMLCRGEIDKLQGQSRGKMVRQLCNQIKIQSTMSHANIIKLYTFFHDTANIYLFLQLGTDGHLLDLLDQHHHLQEQTTSVLVRQIIRGLRYMHSRHIIHRDVKLENIVLTCGMAKICDFGWATYEPSSLRETVCGTPIYLSPQILKGKKYNCKIDIWAIGTLAHELAVGDNPFKVRKRQDLQNIVSKDFQMTVGSLQLRSFITFILRKQPQRRPDTQILMKHPFITKYRHIETAQQL